MGKFYVISDLHGRWDIFKQVLENIMNENDTLYVLGDCGDRGPDGWKCIKAALDDPRCVYIMGNHEKMLIEAFYEKEEMRDFICSDYRLLLGNGGLHTFEEMMLDKNHEEYIERLTKLPYFARLVKHDGKSILLTHSGYEPEDFADITKEDKYELVWNRDCYIGDFPSEKFDVIIHGHTCIQDMIEDINDTRKYFSKKPPIEKWDGTAYFYCGGHRINIDGLAWINNQAILLDLDTFETTIIKGGGAE